MKKKCTRCRCLKKILFENTYSVAIKSGLDGEPEKVRVALCAGCIINFARTQLLEISYNHMNQLAGKGNKVKM